MVRVSVRNSRDKYVLIRPCWGLVENLIMGVCRISLLLGPIFSFQVWSIRWVEMYWAQLRLILGRSR